MADAQSLCPLLRHKPVRKGRLCSFSLLLMVAVGPLAAVHAHIDSPNGVVTVLGFKSKEQSWLGLHIDEERIGVATRNRPNVFVDEQPADRPDVEVRKLKRLNLTVDADMASRRPKRLDT